MYKITQITIAILCIIAITCSACFDFTKEKVIGNGELTSTSQELSPFHSLSVNGNFKTTYMVDPQYKISIVGESNLLKYIKAEVDKGVLVINLDEEVSIQPSEDINLLIQGPPLSSIVHSGSGDMAFGTITNDAAIKITLAGSGKISGLINVPNVTVMLTGNGHINLSGQVIGSNVTVVGSGSFKAPDLVSSATEAQVKGSGSIYTGRPDKLTATIVGSGNIYYKGDPELVTSVTGSGKIRASKD